MQMENEMDEETKTVSVTRNRLTDCPQWSRWELTSKAA